MFKCDYHTHSIFSFDGAPEATLDAICEAAISHGVTDLALTDHFESNSKAESVFTPYDANGAREAVLSAKDKYKSKLNLTYGVEIGQANQYPDEAKALLSSHNYEFVIGSIHNVMGAPDFYFFDFAKLSAFPTYIGHFFERYVNELCDVVDALPKIDTVAHLTYMQRYCELCGEKYDFTKHFGSVEKLYKKIISKDIALEVNVSTLWKGLGFAIPDREFLALYRECGGRLITVGTDSHSPEHIGECVEDGFRLLRSVGLSDILVVREGKKEVIKI